jgi:hypothetical protein
MTSLRNPSRQRALAAVALTALLYLAGCGDGLTYVPVKGKVTLKNAPVTAGTVVFVPSVDNPLRVSAKGKLNPDGTFELTTDGKSGVPIGSYVACVQPQMRRVNGKEAPPRIFADKYIDANDNPLKIEVVANPAPGAYDLILTAD